MLDALSPINKLERVVAPDASACTAPTIPMYRCNEAEQVVTGLRKRATSRLNTFCFLMKGTAFVKEQNRIAAAVAIVNWFRKHL